MGVRGLTSFLRTIEAHILNKIELKAGGDASGQRDEPTPFVVDALAFLFSTFERNFGDSLFGGEYSSYVRFVLDCVKAWRDVGLNPIFVFDGTTPEIKMDTVSARFVRKAGELSVYMRSSAESRTSIAWQTESSFLPPLLIDSLFEALKRVEVPVVIAPREADPIIVALAGQLGGYAVSSDSDMYIFNPLGGKYKGYVPIETLTYVCHAPAASTPSRATAQASSSSPTAQQSAPAEDDGFTAVVGNRKGRRGKQPPFSVSSATIPPPPSDPAVSASSGAFVGEPVLLAHPPPSEHVAGASPTENLSLEAFTFSTYLPSELAEYLDLPIALLPVFAALLGNDYSHSSHLNVVYNMNPDVHMRPNPIQRTQLCVRALREEWTATVSPSARAGAGRTAGSGLSARGSASTPGSPGPWRRGMGTRLGSGRGTPRTPGAGSSSDRSSSTQGTPSAALDSSFISIRSTSSTGFTASGFSTPRARGSEWGGEGGPDDAGEDDDDGRSLVSDAAPVDPVRALVTSVIKRIIAATNGEGGDMMPREGGYGSSSFGGGWGTTLPMGRTRRPWMRKVSEVEGTAEWNGVVDAILEGVQNYALLIQRAPDPVGRPDLSRFTAHLASADPLRHAGLSASTVLLDEGGEEDSRAERLKIMERYGQAFQDLRFFNSLADVMSFRLYLPRFVIEDPDQATVMVGAPRQIRRWVYALLFGAYGFDWARDTIEPPEDSDEEGGASSDGGDAGAEGGAKPVRGGLTSSWIMPNAKEAEGDPDELILVQTPPSVSSYVETDSSGNDDDDGGDDEVEAGNEKTGTSLGQALSVREQAREKMDEDRPAPVVTEMVRRAERWTQEAVAIPSLTDLLRERGGLEALNRDAYFAPLRSFAASSIASTPEGHKPALPPVQLLQSDERTRALALNYILRGGRHIEDEVSLGLRLLALTLRFVLLLEGERWGLSAPKHNWRRRELEAAAYAGSIGLRLWRQGSETAAVRRTNAWAYPSPYPHPSTSASTSAFAPSSSPTTTGPARVAPSVRAVHLSSTLQTALESAHMLRQVLLLPWADAPVHALHEGPLFHAFLTTTSFTSAHAQQPESPSPGPGPGQGRLYMDAQTEGEIAEVVAAVLAGVDEEVVLGRDLEEERKARKKQLRAAKGAGGGGDAEGVDREEGKKGPAVLKNRKGPTPTVGLGNLYAALQVED
ncbi:hypothetical protein OC844_003625 [Tilletia horrida]|nr:hypothetical protein OC844_003625 [Tilletia horrida]